MYAFTVLFSVSYVLISVSYENPGMIQTRVMQMRLRFIGRGVLRLRMVEGHWCTEILTVCRNDKKWWSVFLSAKQKKQNTTYFVLFLFFFGFVEGFSIPVLWGMDFWWIKKTCYIFSLKQTVFINLWGWREKCCFNWSRRYIEGYVSQCKFLFVKC